MNSFLTLGGVALGVLGMRKARTCPNVYRMVGESDRLRKIFAYSLPVVGALIPQLFAGSTNRKGLELAKNYHLVKKTGNLDYIDPEGHYRRKF